MTAKQFEKRVSSVLERKYRKYNITGFKVWKEGKHLFLSVRIGVDLIRTEPWGVSAVFDSEGKCLNRSCGSRRDYRAIQRQARRSFLRYFNVAATPELGFDQISKKLCFNSRS